MHIYTYDSLKKMFVLWRTFEVEGCGIIRGIVIGRSNFQMRLFVTCASSGNTYVKLVDRVSVPKN